jgi:hypothetical protein
MKTKSNFTLALFVIEVFLAMNCPAQTQTVTLAVPGGSGNSTQNSQTPSVSYSVATNQIVQIVSMAGQSGVAPLTVVLNHASGVSIGTTNLGTFTGLSNVTVSAPYTYFVSGGVYYYTYNPALVTLNVTTPPNPANVVSNYVPADAIVIPASATGNVQIILESSPDLVNWTAASPGTYGASAGTNRFFRVRAVVSP